MKNVSDTMLRKESDDFSQGESDSIKDKNSDTLSDTVNVSVNDTRTHDNQERSLYPCNFNNPGNLCYMAAGIQYLWGSPKFMLKLYKLRYELYEKHPNLTCSVIDSIAVLEFRGGSTQVPSFKHFKFQSLTRFRKEFVTKLKILEKYDLSDRYASDDQQDVHEFLHTLIWVFKKELCKWNHKISEEDDLFGIDHLTQKVFCCTNCEYNWIHHSTGDKQPMFIPLPIHGKTSVAEQYKMYFGWEPINGMACRECGSKEDEDGNAVVFSRMSLVNKPETIFIMQKRYFYNYELNECEKDQTFVEFEQDIKINEVEYKLTAFINHEGSNSVEHGHYWCIRHTGMLTDEIWVICNDQYNVKQVREINEVHQKHTYLLSYRRKEDGYEMIDLGEKIIEWMEQLSESSTEDWPLQPLQPTNQTIIQQEEQISEKPFTLNPYTKKSKFKKLLEKHDSENYAKVKALDHLQQYSSKRKEELNALNRKIKEKNGKGLPKEALEDELNTSLHRKRREMAYQENALISKYNKAAKMVGTHERNPRKATKLANENMNKYNNLWNHMLKKDTMTVTPVPEKSLIKTLKHPTTTKSLILGNLMEKNQSKKDLKEGIKKDEKKKELDLKRQINALQRDASKQRRKAEIEKKKAEEYKEIIKNLEKIVHEKQIGIKRTFQEPTSMSLKDKKDFLDSLMVPTLKDTSTSRQWKIKAKPQLPLELKDKKSLSKKTSKKRKREINHDEPSTISKSLKYDFDNTKGRKQSKLPKSHQIKKKAVRDLHKDFLAERYDSDNSLVTSVRTVSESKRQVNPFKKKEKEIAVKKSKKNETTKKTKKNEKKTKEVIELSSDEESSDDSMVS